MKGIHQINRVGGEMMERCNGQREGEWLRLGL